MKKDTIYTKIQRYFFNNVLFVLIWMIIVFLGSMITIYEGFEIIANFYKNTFGYKEVQLEKLTKLKTNTHIDNYVQEFGTPTLIKTISQSNLKIYIYSTEYYYLDFVTNFDGNVIVYGVTSKKTDFNPSFSLPGSSIEEPQAVTLNETSFYDISPQNPSIMNYVPDTSGLSLLPYGDFCLGFWGARRFGYYETQYIGNMANYQTIIIGINDAGSNLSTNTFIDEFLSNNYNSDKGYDCKNLTVEARKGGIINTYRETAPHFETIYYASSSAEVLTGVDLDELRVIN